MAAVVAVQRAQRLVPTTESRIWATLSNVTPATRSAQPLAPATQLASPMKSGSPPPSPTTAKIGTAAPTLTARSIRSSNHSRTAARSIAASSGAYNLPHRRLALPALHLRLCRRPMLRLLLCPMCLRYRRRPLCSHALRRWANGPRAAVNLRQERRKQTGFPRGAIPPPRGHQCRLLWRRPKRRPLRQAPRPRRRLGRPRLSQALPHLHCRQRCRRRRSRRRRCRRRRSRRPPFTCTTADAAAASTAQRLVPTAAMRIWATSSGNRPATRSAQRLAPSTHRASPMKSGSPASTAKIGTPAPTPTARSIPSNHPRRALRCIGAIYAVHRLHQRRPRRCRLHWNRPLHPRFRPRRPLCCRHPYSRVPRRRARPPLRDHHQTRTRRCQRSALRSRWSPRSTSTRTPPTRVTKT